MTLDHELARLNADRLIATHDTRVLGGSEADMNTMYEHATERYPALMHLMEHSSRRLADVLGVPFIDEHGKIHPTVLAFQAGAARMVLTLTETANTELFSQQFEQE